LGKSVHLNRPGKKHNSGFGLLPTAVTKIKKKKKKKHRSGLIKHGNSQSHLSFMKSREKVLSEKKPV